MKRLLPWIFLAGTCSGAKEKLAQADLAKLRDPAARQAEVARLAGCDGKERILTSFRFHPCPQKESEALFALTADYDYDFQTAHSFGDEYEIEKPEELFGADAPPPALAEPHPARIKSHLLMIFGPDGKELRPFAGNNMVSNGYLFDLNRDGILERADSSSHRVQRAAKDTIDVFDLETVERQPRSLLRVIFNWHPNRADDVNEWSFQCEDTDGDGFFEIAFGPKHPVSEEDARRHVFRWNAAAGRYETGEIPAGSHIRVLQAEENLPDIAKAGGLGYAIEGEPDPDATKPANVTTPKPYVFRSLSDASDAELLAFFRGRERRDSFDAPQGSVATHLPEGFWDKPAKQAALAFAEANRTPAHRMDWKLALDDRGGIEPPKSGWWLHDWGSSGCYSYSSHIFALRFGIAKPLLIATDYNSHGAVDRNPLADQPGYGVRVIELSVKEASFLAETLFWLDRVRARAHADVADSHGSTSSTADGFASLHLFADGSPPKKIADGTVWAMDSVSAQWKESYTPELCLNLTEHLIADAFPGQLGKRWQLGPELERRSLATPLEKRLEARLDDTARKTLAANIGRVLDHHQADAVPSPVLGHLVEGAGEEALLEVRPALERLKAALPPRGAEDGEFDPLEKRFDRDHFGNQTGDDPDKHPEDYQRYQELREKRELQAAPLLRDPLDAALEKLRIAGDAKLLLKEVRSNGNLARWSLNRLRSQHPQVWSDYLIGEFQQANLESRRQLFSTLGAAPPQAAKDLIALLSPSEVADILSEAAEFQIQHDPARAVDRIPALIDCLEDRKQNFTRRCEAMACLGQIPLEPAALEEVTKLLLAELKDPQKGSYPGAESGAAAVAALSRLPGATRYLDEITAFHGKGHDGFDTGLDVLLRLTEGRPDQMQRLESYVRPHLKDHGGMMNDVFLAALALDLRGLASDIAAMATEGPAVQDGDGANYSGGNFAGPSGERYHIAREVTALWNEQDPAARGRMWIALGTSRPYDFDTARDQSLATVALRDQAAGDIRSVPAAMRKTTLAAMLTGSTAERFETAAWLSELAEAP